MGQVEGGFVQGMGWLTTEELWWNGHGLLMTHAPSTYKIPACGDRPRIFNVSLLEGARNREDSIFRSKAVGEPPLMLAFSVREALRQAAAAFGPAGVSVELASPATPEAVYWALDAARSAHPAPEPAAVLEAAGHA
jgi:xanthine dehydrogenase large subunit